jgi:UDP-N-acetyl-alpha-D-quinovosamine dehydrogenase
MRPRLVPVPASLLEGLGILIGRRAAVQRLTDSLQADSSAFRRAAAWSPPFTVSQGIEETVRWFRSLRR